MCRIFGFRSVIQSQVHHSLVGAENALQMQSEKHPDGWGVAYFLAGAPHIVKSSTTAIKDSLFKQVSGIVSSETVIAHIRRTTVGTNNILNTHPFQYGRWVFCHNGNIKNFDEHREKVKALIQPELRRFILGETDSEVIFYLVLSHLQKSVDLKELDVPMDALARACRDAVKEIVEIAGPYSENNDGDPLDTYLTFVISNGQVMISHQGGKALFSSTYKTRCGERDTCPSFAPHCEAATDSGFVNHLVFSSEPLSGENIWLPMTPGQLIGVDGRMKLHYF